ncbi:MAG: hypothetical protein K8T89_06445 [Planctomycetes bacterium]|nr:hypothetical protein [Planctomycetota bacterium]
MKSLSLIGALLLSGSYLMAAETVTMKPAPTPESLKAIELVRDLGDARYKVRDEAARELKKLGRHAKAALLDGMKSTDPEVWNHCAQLLPEVMALDLKARVDGFLADADGKLKHDLPMMDSYQKLVGNDAPSRKLYADMVKTNAAFLEACEQAPKLAGEKYAIRAQELQQHLFGPWSGTGARPQLQASDLAPLFLIGADPVMTKGIVTANNINPVSNFLWQQPFQNALRNGEQAVPFRKLFFAWAENRNDINSISQTLSVIQNMNLKEGIDFAVKVMKMKDLQIWTRAQALTCVGKMGGKEHLAAMEAMLEDKTQVTNIQWNNVNISTQINDIALAMAIHLSGQKHNEYGFDALQSQPGLLWAYHYLGFSTDEKRKVAYKKYADWSAAQKNNKK